MEYKTSKECSFLSMKQFFEDLIAKKLADGVIEISEGKIIRKECKHERD